MPGVHASMRSDKRLAMLTGATLPAPCHMHTPQRNALSYFNFMNDEGRPVVGALLPAGCSAGGDEQQQPQQQSPQ